MSGRLLLLALAVVAAIVLGAPAAQAKQPGGLPAAVRDHGRGHWFRHVCALPGARAAWCGAQVVTSSAGVPLAYSAPPSSALTPAQFHSAYALPATAASGTPTIGIVDATDDPNIESDLAIFDAQFNLPACTTANGCFRKVDQSGGTHYPTKTSWHLEIALDVEVAHAICQNCKILLVEASSTSMTNLGEAVDEAVALGANVVSNSYGGDEFAGELADDSAYYKHPGIPIVVSSGDSGYGVEYPASSQYVTAVGGTTLTLNADGSYGNERAWSGAGSGCSAYEPKPAWQEDTGCANRSVADVSADADPNSGAAIFDSVGAPSGSGWFQVGGTSLSAPLVGAAYALAGATTSYGNAPYADPAALNDVSSGANGSCSPSYLCTSGAGYDGPTGLGTPHGLGAFGGAAAPAPDFSFSASSSTQTVVQGDQASYPFIVAPANGFSGTVAYSVAGVPPNARASFTGSSLNVSTAGVTPGTYTLTVTGTSGTLSHSIDVTLAVQDFSLSLTPSTQDLTQGATIPYSVVITGLNGFSAAVSLSVSGLPKGVSGSFGPATGSTYTLTLTAAPTATVTSKTLTVTATSGSDSRTARATVRVQPSPADFSLALAPSSQSANAGADAMFTVSVSPVNGFSGTVQLSQIGLPPETNPTFSPSAPTTISTLDVSTGSLTPGASYPFTITGTSGGLTHTLQGTLAINNGAAATLSVTPASAPRATKVTVTWSGVANPSSTDWIGIFTPGAPSTSDLRREYDSTCAAGRTAAARSAGSCSFKLPSAPGQYELRLLENDGTPIVSGVLVTVT